MSATVATITKVTIKAIKPLIAIGCSASTNTSNRIPTIWHWKCLVIANCSTMDYFAMAMGCSVMGCSIDFGVGFVVAGMERFFL
jgi:hypothetical protein